MNDDNQDFEMCLDGLPSACQRVRTRLHELWDDELTPIEAARDRGHLEACESCAEEWRILEQLLESVAQSRVSAPELDWITGGLSERLAEADVIPPRSDWSRWMISTALPIAAGIAAMVLIHTVSKNRGSIGEALPVSILEVGSWRPPVTNWTRGVEQLLQTDGESQRKEG